MAQLVKTYNEARAWADAPENRERPIIIRHVSGGYWLFDNADDAMGHPTAQVRPHGGPNMSKYV